MVGKKLNEEGIIPVLFGSLAVVMLTGKDIVVNDIDLLVPDAWVAEKWGELIKLMSRFGFVVHNETEHEFVLDNKIVAFAYESTLGDVALTTADLLKKEVNEVKFLLPKADQLLKVYQYSRDDGYRLGKRNDNGKISLLEEFIRLT